MLKLFQMQFHITTELENGSSSRHQNIIKPKLKIQKHEMWKYDFVEFSSRFNCKS